jgi:minimal PKS acyl carrier protein
MPEPFTFRDLKDILVNRVGLAERDVPTDVNARIEDMGIDSLAFIEIQLALEQKYGFRVADAESAGIHTLQDAVDFTNRKLQEQG